MTGCGLLCSHDTCCLGVDCSILMTQSFKVFCAQSLISSGQFCTELPPFGLEAFQSVFIF